MHQCNNLYREVASRKHLTLDVQFAGNMPRSLLGDSLKIRQIVNNMISNAIKFTDSGGVQEETCMLGTPCVTPEDFLAGHDESSARAVTTPAPLPPSGSASLGAGVEGDGGAVEPTYLMLPRKDVEIVDDWHVSGLRGTGSRSVRCDNVFVPEHRTVSFSTLRDACSPGSKINTNPIYRTPFIAVHSYALVGPAMGLARGAYAEFVEWTRKRYLTYTQLAIAQHVPVQIAVADIAAQIDTAELLARRCLAKAKADYAGMTMETRILIRRDWTYAMRQLRAAMDSLIKISGSSGLMESNPVQRCWRDVHAISSHIVMNWDVPAENFGRTEFGLGRNEAYPAF